MCQIFGVSRSGYYDYVKRKGQPQKDAPVVAMLCQHQERCHQTYGYRRMHRWLENQGIHYDPKTILRIMKRYGILSEIRRKRQWQNLGQQLHRYKNLLNRNFQASKPNEKWVTDISYIHTKEGVSLQFLFSILHYVLTWTQKYPPKIDLDISMVYFRGIISDAAPLCLKRNISYIGAFCTVHINWGSSRYRRGIFGFVRRSGLRTPPDGRCRRRGCIHRWTG